MNLLDLLTPYGQYPRVSVKEHAGPCPWCGGRDRFRIWPEQSNGGSYWCRQCDRKGDTLQFVRDMDNLSCPDAHDRLGRSCTSTSCSVYNSCRLGNAQPAARKKKQTNRTAKAKQTTKATTWHTTPADMPSKQWLDRAALLVERAHHRLMKNSQALQWLIDRGFTPSTIKKNKLGWLDRDPNTGRDRRDHRSAWGLPIEDKPTLWLPQGLIIPRIDTHGNVTRIRIRRPEADRDQFLADVKYYVMPGSTRAPLLAGSNQQAIVVVEAELDAILIAQEAGDICSAYAIGNSSANPDTDHLQDLQQATVVLVAIDFDEPDQHGRRPGSLAMRKWLANLSNSKRWPVPAGKDPGDYVQDHSGNLRYWITAGLPPVLLLNAEHDDQTISCMSRVRGKGDVVDMVRNVFEGSIV